MKRVLECKFIPADESWFFPFFPNLRDDFTEKLEILKSFVLGMFMKQTNGHEKELFSFLPPSFLPGGWEKSTNPSLYHVETCSCLSFKITAGTPGYLQQTGNPPEMLIVRFLRNPANVSWCLSCWLCPQRCSTLFNVLGIIVSQLLAAAVGIVLCYPDLWQIVGHLLDLSLPIGMANLFKLIEFRITMNQLLGMSVRESPDEAEK